MHERSFRRRGAGIAMTAAALALLAGCADMRGIAPETTPVDPNTLASRATLDKARIDAKSWPAADWWTAFDDPGLDRLVDEALGASPTLAIAEARTRRALALADVARAGLFPQTNVALEVNHERFSENALIPPPYAGTWNTDYLLNANLTWEIDFWGKQRSTFESALGHA
ncbi:MAG: TolC family protein, partial [Casimicrobiaceae bacterium]